MAKKPFTKQWRNAVKQELVSVGFCHAYWIPGLLPNGRDWPRMEDLYDYDDDAYIGNDSTNVTVVIDPSGSKRAWATTDATIPQETGRHPVVTAKLPDPTDADSIEVAVGFATGNSRGVGVDFFNYMPAVVFTAAVGGYNITAVWDNGELGEGTLIQLDPEDYTLIAATGVVDVGVAFSTGGDYGTVHVFADGGEGDVEVWSQELPYSIGDIADLTRGYIDLTVTDAGPVTVFASLVDGGMDLVLPFVDSSYDNGIPSGIDQDSYPTDRHGRAYEVSGLEDPVQDDLLGEVSNGNVFVFNKTGDLSIIMGRPD